MIASQCDYWSIVTTDSSVAKEVELPEWWGWYICSGASLRVKKRPVKNPHKQQIGNELLSGLLRRAAEAVDAAPKSAEKELNDKYTEGWIAGRKASESETERATKKYEELDDKVRAFESETGLHINGGWHLKNGITAQQFNWISNLLIGDRAQDHLTQLARWHGRLQVVMDEINRDFTTLGSVLKEVSLAEWGNS